jgi:hypothetical protein
MPLDKSPVEHSDLFYSKGAGSRAQYLRSWRKSAIGTFRKYHPSRLGALQRKSGL